LPLRAYQRSASFSTARARDVVEHAYPLWLGNQRDERWAADRAQMEHLLHLNIGLVRSPLTA
jgi:hypothetical protein